ncbi:MAG TPA: flagellar export protein FliJ [Scandinavium sp.]|uniref:flagellar export protein FliJ n=1 Tax=Scandinavium sp. TaxID=2830653 RepID=UPI002E31B2D2|nr:flagellar export protein FliJ [Scandinavium sp.]HEX4499795.1 flagellar export protein FliJ [Scandinavium sp.]
MSRMITTLEQLKRLRHQSVDDLTSKLTHQQQVSNRCDRNIDALNSLAGSVTSERLLDATMMTNHSAYKNNIQRIVNWQKQQQALADAEARQLKAKLLVEAKREKSVELLLDMRRDDLRKEQERSEQKQTDAASAQAWLRQHQGR